jgi:hypothetical protein
MFWKSGFMISSWVYEEVLFSCTALRRTRRYSVRGQQCGLDRG